MRSDPRHALRHHLNINQPPDDQHLFAYRHNGSWRELHKSTLISRLRKAGKEGNIRLPSGHAFRIGGTLEYLLRGVSFEAMRVKGRWASDAYLKYLRKHAEIMAPYMGEQPAVGEAFTRYALLPVR
jgi:hypothetical protein